MFYWPDSAVVKVIKGQRKDEVESMDIRFEIANFRLRTTPPMNRAAKERISNG